MHQSHSISPTMIDAPWLDKPTQITESELDDLESNYEAMLSTIRNDTFGGIAPPKYNTNYINTIHTNPFINSDNNTNLFHYNTNDNNSNLLSQIGLGLFDINSSTINDSMQRVRNELNHSHIIPEEQSPLLSPIAHSNNNSLININLNDIKMDDSQDDIKNNSHNLSLPFISPTSNDNITFISQSLSPPIFNNNTDISSRRTQSEQPTNSIHSHIYNNNNNNNNTNSVPPIPMSNISNNESQILNNIGLPDSVTTSMMFTPSVSRMMAQHRNNNNNNNNNSNNSNNNSYRSNFDINNAPQRNRSGNRNYNRRNSDHYNNNLFDIDSMNNNNNNNIYDDSTPVTMNDRSNSVSLDVPTAPRLQRRIRRAVRNEVASIDLTRNNV
eukprot:121639_1